MIFRQGREGESQWAIWKTEETKEQLIDLIGDKSFVEDILRIKSEARMMERLAVRALLKQLSGENLPICYHPTGKPYLKGKDVNISISHTQGYVAVAWSPLNYVGIDIQVITDKVRKVRPRFVSDTEYIDPAHETAHLLVHWSAKEAMYKALGISVRSIAEQFHIAPFELYGKGICRITEKVTPDPMSFDIHYFFEQQFVFTYLYK